jgi:predicted RNA-binding protein with PUA-like domain
MKYWLMKSEPDECSIDDVLAAPGRKTPWSGVRNYQARNFMRDEMRVGDGVLFYHSSCAEPGVAGLAEVASAPYLDQSQFDRKSPYYDPASKREAPRWMNVDVRALRKTRLVPLAELRKHKRAWKFFEAQAPSYRRVAAFWVMSAKQDETRKRRLARLIEHSQNGERVPAFVSPARRRAPARGL